eukprot:g2078.t1
MGQAHKGERRIEKKNCILLGFGAVGQRCVELISKRSTFGDRIRIVGVADSSSGVYCKDGIDLIKVLHCKKEKGCLKSTNASEREVKDSSELFTLARENELDVVIDLAPYGNTVTLEILKSALSNGIDCVLANKAPLVNAFHVLKKLAKTSGAKFAYSATICGGLPVANVASRDLVGCNVESIQGIFNSTSNFILSEMRRGQSRDDALKEAQKRGIAEADPTLDVRGYDAASKIVILANTMGIPAKIDFQYVKGIEDITANQIREAAEKRNNVIRLVASLMREKNSTSYTFSVKPIEVKIDSFLGSCDGTSMCVQFRTDIYETISMMTDEKGVYPTSAAVLRDVLSLS